MNVRVVPDWSRRNLFLLASKIGISIHFSVGVGVCTYQGPMEGGGGREREREWMGEGGG